MTRVKDLSGYVGRFAPSPTGDLHFGSLVAAVASFLDARAAGGSWLVRMEDLDTERVRTGAADSILGDLEAFGLEWDGEVVFQSQRAALYEEAFGQLRRQGDIYGCACSRRDSARRHAGDCARGLKAGQAARSWRVRVPEGAVYSFVDRVCGEFEQDVQREIGDFIVRRADGPFAYQLAVVVDDAAQGVTNVVRGADLLDNTPRQMFLQQRLGLGRLTYAHVPLAMDQRGAKLSKSAGAGRLDRREMGRELRRALKFLGQKPPEDVAGNELLRWAIREWDIGRCSNGGAD
jgi:glutamyl-Q tRNA(Asp) synthetase